MTEFACQCADCRHETALKSADLYTYLGAPPNLKNINQIFKRLVCQECRSKNVRLLTVQGDLLLNSESLPCRCCGNLILEPRRKALPETFLCTLCAEENERPAVPSPYPKPPLELTKCPRCGAPTVVRENSKSGSYFFGCTSFPRCRWRAEPSTSWYEVQSSNVVT
jgi:hypothetical protein